MGSFVSCPGPMHPPNVEGAIVADDGPDRTVGSTRGLVTTPETLKRESMDRLLPVGSQTATTSYVTQPGPASHYPGRGRGSRGGRGTTLATLTTLTWQLAAMHGSGLGALAHCACLVTFSVGPDVPPLLAAGCAAELETTKRCRATRLVSI
jgi:hypothetical protein